MRAHRPSPPGAPVSSAHEPTEPTPGWALFCGAATLVLFAVLAWHFHFPGPRVRNDDAQYILLARSLRSFQYLDWHILGAPYHTQYPPGYPFFLAVISSLFGERWTLFIIANLAFSLVALAMVFDVARRLWSPTVAVATLGVAALVPAWLYPIGPAANVLADAPYTALTVGVLWILAVKPRSAGWLASAGALAILAALTRSIGVTMLAALFLLWLLERRWKAAALLLVTASATVGSWLLWTVVAGNRVVGRSYIADALATAGVSEASPGPLRVLIHRMAHGVVRYGTHEVPVAFGLPHIAGTPIDNIVGIGLLFGFGAVGFVVVWRRWRGAGLYLTTYVGLLLVWPWVLDRFLVPILPLIVLSVIVGAASVVSKARRGAFTLAVALLLVLCASRRDLQLMASANGVCDEEGSGESCHLPAQQAFFDGLDFIRDSMPRGEPVVSIKDATFTYVSDHPVLPAYRVMRGEASLRTSLEAAGVQYVFFGWVPGPDTFQAAERIMDACADFDLVRTFGNRAVLVRLRPEGPSGASCGELRRLLAKPLDPVER